MPTGADEGVGPERRRLLELHADRVVVDLDDLHVLVAADGHRGGRRIGGVFPVEDAVIGGERMAVVPLHALLELPGDRRAVLGQAAVLDGRDLRGEHRHQVAIGVPPGQRLVEHARAVLVLGADREVRVQQRRALPPQHLERPAAAALGRLVDRLLRRHGHTGERQHLRRHGRGEAECDHGAGECAARQPAPPHVLDQTTQVLFVHCGSPFPRAPLRPDARQHRNWAQRGNHCAPTYRRSASS